MKTRNMLELGGFAIVLVAGVLSFAIWQHNAPSVPLRDLSKIRAYISKAEVMSLLGEPDDEESVLHLPGSWRNEESYRRAHEVDSQWWYRRRFKRYTLRIDFASDETVVRYVHEDLKRQREELEKHLHDRDIMRRNLSSAAAQEVFTSVSEARNKSDTRHQKD